MDFFLCLLFQVFVWKIRKYAKWRKPDFSHLKDVNVEKPSHATIPLSNLNRQPIFVKSSITYAIIGTGNVENLKEGLSAK